MALSGQSNFNRVLVEDLVVKNNLKVLGTETVNNQVINQNSIAVDEIQHRNTTVIAIGNTATTQVTVDGNLIATDPFEAQSSLTVLGSSKHAVGVDTDTLRPIAPATKIDVTGDLDVSGGVSASQLSEGTIVLTGGEITTLSSTDLSINPTGTDIDFNNKNLTNVGIISGLTFQNIRTGAYSDASFDSGITTNRNITVPFATPMSSTSYTVSIIPKSPDVTEIMHKTNNGAYYIVSKTVNNFTVYIGGYSPGGGGVITMSFDWMAIS